MLIALLIAYCLALLAAAIIYHDIRKHPHWGAE